VRWRRVGRGTILNSLCRDNNKQLLVKTASRTLILAAIIVPVALLGVAGWVNYHRIERESKASLHHSVEGIAEHAVKTLRSHEVILDLVDAVVAGREWAEIAGSAELHQILKRLVRGSSDVASVFLLAPDGRTWVSSRRFPMPALEGTDRDYFQFLREHDALYVSTRARGRLQHDVFFSVARRRSNPSGVFDGVIALSVDPAYFESFYASLHERAEDVIGLMRNDGFLLARDPWREDAPRDKPVKALFELHPTSDDQMSVVERTTIAGAERLLAYRRVSSFPVYAFVHRPVEALWTEWRSAMLPYVLACALAIALLLSAALLTTLRLKQLTAELRVREAEAVGRAKDEFIAVLSHELRNPIGSIANAAEVLQRAPGSTSALQIIGRQIGHLRRLLDDLLDTSRAVHGKLELRRSRVDLRELATTVIAEHAPPQRVKAEVDAPDEAWVEGDPVRLKQMLVNLVDNAVKYGASRITIRIRAEGDMVVVRVEDDGEGITADLLPQLFKPFVHGSSHARDGQGGLGLGLALVHRLALMHGGTLTAASDGPGRGSCFTLTMPRARS
jgi:signal transduction histidine kinase